MSFIKRNDLDRYAGKLNTISSNNLANQIAELLADKGKSIAEKEYNNTSILVTTNIHNNIAQIVANGKQIAYLEYGTGLIGDGTYKGKLPKNGVPITGEWTYYYDSPYKTFKNGKKGWYIKNGVFIEGQVAGNQMFNTAKSLREYVKYGIISKDFKRKLGK